MRFFVTCPNPHYNATHYSSTPALITQSVSCSADLVPNPEIVGRDHRHVLIPQQGVGDLGLDVRRDAGALFLFLLELGEERECFGVKLARLPEERHAPCLVWKARP